MAIDPSIAMGYRGLGELPNPMNQLAQVSQIQQSMRQNQMAESQFKKAQDEEIKLSQWYAGIAANGGPTDPVEIENRMIGSGVPKVANIGLSARMTRLRQEEDRKRFAEANAPTALPAATPTEAPVNMMPGVDAAPAGVNSLSAPPQARTTIDGLTRQIAANMALGTDQGYKNAERLQKQVDALNRRYTVGNTLMGAGGEIVATAPQQPRQPNLATDLMIPDPNNPNKLIPNAALIEVKKGLRPLGTTVNVKLPPVENAYSTTFAKNTAEDDIKMLGAARTAPKVAATANRVTELLNKPDIFVGPAATVKLNVARALSVLGADETESMRNTEKLIAAAGQGTLDAIKDAGLGTGQGFTAKDLEFLTNVAGGKIDFTAENLRTMSRLQYRAAELSVKKFITRRGNMPESATKGTGIDKETYELPARTGGPTPEAIAYLKANPKTTAAFDQRYGDGEAAHTLRMGK